MISDIKILVVDLPNIVRNRRRRSGLAALAAEFGQPRSWVEARARDGSEPSELRPVLVRRQERDRLVAKYSPSLGRKWVERIIGDATDLDELHAAGRRLDDHAERKRRGEWPYGVVVGSSGRPSNIKITVGAVDAHHVAGIQPTRVPGNRCR